MSPAARRRRRKPSATARLRPFWIVIVLAVALVAVLGYLAVTWDGFKPKGVDVVGASPEIPRQSVVNAAAIDSDQNVWLLNTHKVALRVESLAYVEQAQVHRGWPNRITVSVTQRVPFARIQTAHDAIVVDSSLRVLQRSASGQFAALPLFRVPEITTAVPSETLQQTPAASLAQAYAQLGAANIRPASLEHDRYGGLNATLANGVVVELGDDDDMPKKIALIGPVLKHVDARLRDVRAIDLRAPSTPVVEYKK